MRTICEIIADLKDGKDVPHEELRMACLVLDAVVFFYKKDVAALLKGGVSADLKIQMEYSDLKTSSKELGIPSWYVKAIKKDPVEWLGVQNIPGTPEYEQHYKISKAIYEKVMKRYEKPEEDGQDE